MLPFQPNSNNKILVNSHNSCILNTEEQNLSTYDRELCAITLILTTYENDSNLLDNTRLKWSLPKFEIFELYMLFQLLLTYVAGISPPLQRKLVNFIINPPFTELQPNNSLKQVHYVVKHEKVLTTRKMIHIQSLLIIMTTKIHLTFKRSALVSKSFQR